MIPKRMFIRRGLQLAAAAWFAGTALMAQAAYPDQPVKLVIGFPPGGGGDLYGRAIANELAKQIGQPVVVENKAGAGGTIAAAQVAQAKADGYTLLLAMSGNLGSAPAVRDDLPYKVPDDFTMISQLVETPFGLMVAANSPIKNVQDFIKAAKSDKSTYATTGMGGASQIVMEMVKQAAGLKVMPVPYKGSGPVLVDLFSNRVDTFFAPYTPLMGHINSGKMRLLAVSSAERIPSLPQVPTLKESGIPVVMSQWYGLAAPKGTPQPVIDRLIRAVAESLKSPEVLNVYRRDGAKESGLSGAAFHDFVVQDLANYKSAVERGHLKAQ